MADAEIGLQQQRVEKLLAELSVAGPKIPVSITNERQNVDEERSGSDKLNVVSGRIGKRDIPFKRREMYIQV